MQHFLVPDQEWEFDGPNAWPEQNNDGKLQFQEKSDAISEARQRSFVMHSRIKLEHYWGYAGVEDADRQKKTKCWIHENVINIYTPKDINPDSRSDESKE